MNRWKLAVPFIASIASLYATGCVIEERVPMQGEPQAVEVDTAPPPPQYEAVPVTTRPGYIWIGGNWSWTGARYVWVPGRYEAPRRGYRWVAPRYERVGRRYRYVRGHYRR